jgi:hypothetical protein
MITRVLVVAEHDAIAEWLTCMLVSLGIAGVSEAGDEVQAVEALGKGVDAAFVFLPMSDRFASRVTTAAVRACPTPFVVVVSERPDRNVAVLERAGAVRLPWPATQDAISGCLAAFDAKANGTAGDLRHLVGRMTLREAQHWVRRTMLLQALLASNGSRRAAARILGVTRPAVQRMLREASLSELPGEFLAEKALND